MEIELYSRICLHEVYTDKYLLSEFIFLAFIFKYMSYSKMSKCEGNESIKLVLCTAEFVCDSGIVCML